MKAKDEICNLQRMIINGKLDPEEPLFVLRGQDSVAVEAILHWVGAAQIDECPPAKLAEALRLAADMLAWPVKQIPGRPETRRDSRLQGEAPGV